MRAEPREPIEVWEPRCHGEWLDLGIFLICKRGGTDVITLNPPSVGAHPLQVYERLLYEDGFDQPAIRRRIFFADGVCGKAGLFRASRRDY